MNFLSWQFAVAGLVCAAGPIIIHLLNRRRYRIIQWAAMDFLREALQRNRRMLQLRDLILLVLRTAAILLFGLALAQPFFAQQEEAAEGNRALHAVLVVDNSLSMAYEPETSGGTLFDKAKSRAREFIDKLPADSRISVLPLCGSAQGTSPDAFTKQGAIDALDKIEIVDRSGSLQVGLNEARQACQTGPQLAKRIVLIGDQQVANWHGFAGTEQFESLPPVQVVDVSPAHAENVWIADLQVQDGLADVDTPATLVAELQYAGLEQSRTVAVSLAVDGVESATKSVTLDPGDGLREVTFEYLFNGYLPQPGQPALVPVKVSLEPDRLPLDDQRHLVVPVVASLPVVFVDQWGAEDEDATRNRVGETRHLRRLLAPQTGVAAGTAPAGGTAAGRQFVRIRHLKPDQLTRETLEDARAVVLAGLADPGDKVELLRDYVRQGGRLLVAAGGDFDPERWSDAGWLDGQGILPVPLKPQAVGMLPDEAKDQLSPFFLSFDSLAGHFYFQIAGLDERQLRDLYAEPFFFKTAEPDVSDEVLTSLRRTERERLLAELSAVEKPASEDAAPSESAANWLAWRDPLASVDALTAPDDEAARERWLEARIEQAQPRVLAQFAENGIGFLVERRVGLGHVVLCSTGLHSAWNTLPQTNAIVIFDRILRSMIRATLPERNFAARDRLSIPLSAEDRDLTMTLTRPDASTPEILDIGYIAKNVRGVNLNLPLTRGPYRITALKKDDMETTPQKLWEMPLAVNGGADESDLKPMTRDEFDQRLGAVESVRWVGPDEEITLSGRQLRGQDSWWWLILAMLAVLGAELLILAWPALRSQSGAEPSAAAA